MRERLGQAMTPVVRKRESPSRGRAFNRISKLSLRQADFSGTLWAGICRVLGMLTVIWRN